jgi:SpoVK/Ycf46/Vps4 family AAA+-type ATPase
MIAKATAKEAGARFINLDVSQITDKWYGESQKLASAVFTLATKLSPCIIFIDEIDSLLRIRDAHDHEATAMVKAQFMQMWDGLETNNKATVVVMGATNRPKDVDKAILRRMPATFHVGLPDIHQRTAILKRILEMEAVDINVDYIRLSKLTAGFSGSDLREACRSASIYRMKELMASKARKEDTSEAVELRDISNEDMLKAVAKLKESKVHCGTVAQFAMTDLD